MRRDALEQSQQFLTVLWRQPGIQDSIDHPHVQLTWLAFNGTPKEQLKFGDEYSLDRMHERTERTQIGFRMPASVAHTDARWPFAFGAGGATHRRGLARPSTEKLGVFPPDT